MSQVLSEGIPVSQRPGFWKRQFALPATKSQRTFDLWFGILLPISCFVLDPGFMSRRITSGAIFQFPLIVRTLSGIAILALALWWIWGERLRAFDSILAGALIAGGILALTIGINILPLTLVALLMIIGVLGLVPFFTAFVCFREAARAILQDRTRSMGRPGWVASGVAAGVIALAVGYQVAVDRVLERAVDEIAVSTDPATSATAQSMRTLQVIFPPNELGRLGQAALRKSPGSWSLRMKYETAFEAITGRPMDNWMIRTMEGD